MLPSVAEDNARLVNDFRACLVDATCFRLALFSSCSHNYARCQCREWEGAPQHCAMPINKVVKGHLWRHSRSPEGSFGVCFQSVYKVEVWMCSWTEQSQKWEASAPRCAATLCLHWKPSTNIPTCQEHLERHPSISYVMASYITHRHLGLEPTPCVWVWFWSSQQHPLTASTENQ